MSAIHASRQFVLDRIGTPAAQLPGESYRHNAQVRERIYDRYDQYIDEALLQRRPEQALESFLVFLEAERDRDYEAFHYGRELLLGDLSIHVQYPRTDPEPQPKPNPSGESQPQVAATSVALRKLPRWSRRKPARPRGKPCRFGIEHLRARVLQRLGWPHGSIPGECALLTGSDALTEITEFFDQFDSAPITEALVDEAIERLTVLRERDWDAFCYGRTELLGLLPVTVDVPVPASGSQTPRDSRV